MTTVYMTFPELVAYHKLLGNRLKAAFDRGLKSGSLRALPVVQQATRVAKAANPGGLGVGGAVNTGHYLRAWKSRAIPNGVRVFNDSPYAGVIEWGRRAGAKQPPIEAIVRWAQRRLSVKHTIKSGKNKGTVRTRRMREDEARSIAFVIARAIKKRGLLPRMVMGGAERAMANAIFLEVLREFDAALPGGGP